MPKRFIALAAVALAATVAVPVLDAPAASKRTVLAALSGAEEVPAAGAPDPRREPAYGAALVEPGPGRRLCFRIVARGVGDAVAAHIHEGAFGENGPIVVPLFEDPAGNGGFSRRARCVRASSARLVRRIARRPRAFYVNLHTTAFPAGAIRGQLGR